MDLNLIVLAGTVAAEPDIQTFESGSSLMRLLVVVRSTEPRSRIDVIPVVQWDPHPDDIPDGPIRGRGVWVVGAVQRRFWSQDDGRTSRIEVVANEVVIRERDLVREDASADDGHVEVIGDVVQ